MPCGRGLNKESLRKLYLTIRREIPPDVRLLKSNLIVQELINSSLFFEAKRVFCYLSLPEEVHTDKIIEEALKKKKKVFVPLIKGDKILAAQLEDLSQVETGPFSIRQPKDSPPENKIDLDLIIVPGVAFDYKLYRLGFGKGYFDRFLAEYKNKATLIGLAFKEQIIKKLPVNSWDIPLDEVLTDIGSLKG